MLCFSLFIYLFKGHDVEEIRVRTLKNLLSKLELKLLYEEDVIQEQSLLIRLLEWFNFPSCSMQTEVLQLIKTLSKVRDQGWVFYILTGSLIYINLFS